MKRLAESVNLSEVFGTGRLVPASYVQRESVDNKFIAYLSDDKHILIHGASGQGKTMLIKRYLEPPMYCVIQCSSAYTRADVYRMILGEADASFAVQKRRKKGKKISATIKFFSGDTQSEAETTEKAFDIEVSNINDIIRVLRQHDFDKYIVLEDFHYLDRNVRWQIINDLKVVIDKSDLRFIFVGIWLQENKFLNRVGNLGGKIRSIRIPLWTEAELREAIETGEKVLNISFSKQVKDELILNSLNSISILQELCYLVCQAQGINETQSDRIVINDPSVVNKALENHSKQHHRRYEKFILKYSARSVRGVDYWHPPSYYLGDYREMPWRPKMNLNKWIMLALYSLDVNQLINGISLGELLEWINQARVPALEGVEEGALLRKVKRIPRIQRSMGIHPIIVSFDIENYRLHVVDALFIHFLNSDYGQLIRKAVAAITENELVYKNLVSEIQRLRDEKNARSKSGGKNSAKAENSVQDEES